LGERLTISGALDRTMVLFPKGSLLKDSLVSISAKRGISQDPLMRIKKPLLSRPILLCVQRDACWHFMA
jgi:hypothetical protein